MLNLSRLHLRLAHVCAIVCAFVFVSHCADAQTGFASISGRVADSSGAVIQKADVTLKNLDTGVVLSSQSNSDGIYNFPSVQPGNYVMRVEKQGFRSVDVTGLTLYTQDQLARNFTLEVGSTSESITVNSAGATNDSPAVSMTVDREFVENMPLNGRSFQDLIQLTPGAVSAANGVGYSVNGQRNDSNNYTVDGVSANLGGLVNNGNGFYGLTLAGTVPAQTAVDTTQSLASVDTLQEFTIQTSGYAAEYGRNPGAQVQFTTRSGTNDFHGTLFDYLRNTAFDANSFANDYYDRPQTAEHQNDFGGTFGGPLRIPRLYDGKDRSFFFLSYEGLRLLLPNSDNEYTTTQAFRNWASAAIQPFLGTQPLPNAGNNNDGCTITDPSTGQPTDCDGLFYAGYSYPEKLDNYSGRLDQNFGRRIHAFLRYADTPSSIRQGAEQVTSTIVNVHSWTAGLTANISKTVLDDLRFNYSHDGEQSNETQVNFDGAVPFSSNLLIPSAYQGPYVSGRAIIEPSGSDVHVLAAASDNNGGGSTQHQYQLIDSLGWTLGTHSLKFGADWRRLTPSFTVSPYQSNAIVRSLNDVQQGNATFLYVYAYEPGKPIFDNLSLYAQDHWKFRSRLTLDYGLRWDFNPPPGPANGYYPIGLTSSDLTTASATTGHTQPYQTDYHSIGPRFGFAWSPTPKQNHNVTVRGGFGVFFDTAQQVIGQEYANSYPFGATRFAGSEVPMPLSDSALAPPSLSDSLTTPYQGLWASMPNLTAPYTEQWNLSVDAALNQRNTLTASYVGNSGKKLLFTNYYTQIPGNPNFTSVYLTNNAAKSNYNALQVQDVGRIASGLDIAASFTFAHSLDNASTDVPNEAPIYGNSDNDLRRVLNVALNYQSRGVRLEPWIERLMSDWTVANRFSTQSGYPLNIQESQVVLPDGSITYYSPDLVSGVPIYLHGSAAHNSAVMPAYNFNWALNPNAFAMVPIDPSTGNPVRQGTLGRNYIRTPAFWTLNTSIQRSFPFNDRLQLKFRADAFNILNHANLQGLDTNLSDSTFGELTPYGDTIGSENPLYAMGAARSLQFSLKLQF
jgi:hypothetical protein